MADEIEIRNVGGRDGVASEATMQLLLTEFRAKAGSDSRYQKLAERATNLNTQAQNKNTKETNLATKAIKSLAGSAKGFAKEAALGGDRLGDFAEAIFGSSSVLTKFVRFGDDTIDTLRGLTSVGASFNNNIFDMIGASANSAMNLDDFASMVQNNSGIIATFGSTVTAGARNLGQFSKEFRTGIGQEFFAMGFTIGDVNEGLISFLDLERRRSLAGLRTDRASQQAAADYIIQLDQLTKLTGEEREQIADRLRQQMQDAGVRAQVNRLEGTARTNFQNSLAFIESQLSGPLADGLKDLMDGVAQTDLGKALQSQIPGIGQFAQQMFRGGKSVDEVIDAMTNRFGPQLQSLSGQFSKAQLDQMRMSGGITGAIAEILDSSYQINQLTGRDAEAAAEEQKRRDRITATLGGFENAITNIRKFFVDAFLDAANRTDGLSAAFKNLFATVGRLFGDGPGSFAELGPTVTKYFNNWFGTGGSVTNLVNKFSDALATTDWEALLTSIDNTITSFTDWLSGIYETYKSEGFGAALTQAGDNILNSILDLFLGKIENTRADGMGADRRVGGLFKKIFDGMLGILESTGATQFMTRVYDTIYNFLFEEDANGKSKMTTFLSTAYDKINNFLFADNNGQTKMGAFLTNIYDSVMDFFFPTTADTNLNFLQRVKDGILDKLFGEQVNVPLIGPQRPGQVAFMMKVEKLMNEYLGLSLLEQQAGGRSLTEQFTDNFQEFMTDVFASVANGFTNFFNGPEANQLKDTIGDYFEDLMIYLKTIINESGILGDYAISDRELAQEKRNLAIERLLEGKLTGTKYDEAKGFLQSDRAALMRDINENAAILRGYYSQNDTFSQQQGESDLNYMARLQREGMLNPDQSTMMDQLRTIQSQISSIPPRARGTYAATGETSEPDGGLMNIHKGERVLSPEETRAYNQTGGDNKLDQLNNTMMQVVALLAQGNQISERTAKGLRGMTNDYYRGMA